MTLFSLSLSLSIYLSIYLHPSVSVYKIQTITQTNIRTFYGESNIDSHRMAIDFNIDDRNFSRESGQK